MPGLDRIPIIRLYGNLIVPVQGGLSDDNVRQLKSDVSVAVARSGARGLVIDMSGADVMDSYLTGVIHSPSQTVELMGVRTVLCGLSPGIVLTLIEMDMDLGRVSTALNLEAAIELMQEQRARTSEDDEAGEGETDDRSEFDDAIGELLEGNQR